MSGRACFDGRATDAAWPDLRALNYGDGVFRTLLLWDAQLQDLQPQLRRLMSDAQALGLQAPALELLADETRHISAGLDRGVLKIMLMRAGAGRGYAPASTAVHRLMTLSALPQYPASAWIQGVHAGLSEVTISRQPRLAGVKHLNRLEQVLASQAWPSMQGEALMCDELDHLICGTRSNVFVVLAGKPELQTPDLAFSGVAGHMRDKIIGLAAREGIATSVAALKRTDLGHVEEAFLSNSLIGIWPIRSIAGTSLAAPGAMTRRLSARLAHPFSGS